MKHRDLVYETARKLNKSPFQVFQEVCGNEAQAKFYHRSWLVDDRLELVVANWCCKILNIPLKSK